MTSDDTYRSHLESTIASLKYWLPQISDAARIEESQGTGYWRVMATPHVAGACPFELVLRSSRSFDLVLDKELYEDLPLEAPQLFVPLLEAVSEGRVIERSKRSMATGAVSEVMSLVELGSGRSWQAARRVGPADATADADMQEFHDRHFLPYRR